MVPNDRTIEASPLSLYFITDIKESSRKFSSIVGIRNLQSNLRLRLR